MRDLTKVVVVVAPPFVGAFLLLTRSEACGYLRRIYRRLPGHPEQPETLHLFYCRNSPRAIESLNQWLTDPANQMIMTVREALDYFSEDELLVAGRMLDCTIPEEPSCP